jgi:hypothetical protein
LPASFWPEIDAVFTIRRVVDQPLSCLGSLAGLRKWLDGFAGGVVPPVGLHEHGVDLFDIYGFDPVAHGLNEGGGAEVPLTARRMPSEERRMRWSAS